MRNICRRQKKSFNFLNLQVFFGFTVVAKLFIFKAKYEKESCLAAKYAVTGRILFFSAVIGYIFFNHGLQRGGGYFLHKCTTFREKNFHVSVKVGNNN